MKKWLLVAAGVVIGVYGATAVEIPAFTAYTSPDPNRGADRGRNGEITRWDAGTRLSWYGYLAAKGELEISLKSSAAVAV